MTFVDVTDARSTVRLHSEESLVLWGVFSPLPPQSPLAKHSSIKALAFWLSNLTMRGQCWALIGSPSELLRLFEVYLNPRLFHGLRPT